MLKSLGRFHSLVVPLLTWLVLLIPFAFYQRYYVSSQQAYLTEHGFRLLSAVGRQLNSYIDSVNKTVRAAQKYKELHERIGLVKEKYLKDAISDLDIAAEDFDDKRGPVNGSLSVVFGPRPAVFQHFPAQFTGQLRLDSAIRERLRGIGEDYFDDVLIADLEGHVLFQRSTDTRITNLDYLAQTFGNSSGTAPASAAKQQADGKNPQPSQGPSFAALSESSNVLQIKLAGVDYKLFLQPLQLAPVETRGGVDKVVDKVVVCGLWRTERLESSSFALPYSSVIWFGLLFVAAGSFAWPFLKINFMSHTERLRRSHGRLLVLSMFLGTASVTLMVLNASYSSNTRSKVDDDLRQLAGQIQKNVDKEIPRALDQLTDLSNDPKVSLGAAKKEDPTFSFLTNSKQTLIYPYFDIAFWVDSNGEQLLKYTVDQNSTPPTSAKDRPYFQDVMRQISTFGPPVAPVLAQIEGRSYSIQPVISRNSGQFQAILAAPFPRFGTEIITVQVLVTKPLSLVNPVLPPDFGFAVLAPDGTVQFHSNPLRNLSENFILECKDPAALQAALFSDSDQKLDVEYSGKQQRALVTKISHLGPEPITLIVFHNSDINLTINMAIILICSVLMGMYIGAIILVAVFLAVIDRLRGSKRPPQSIWPRSECSVRYALIFLVNSLLVAIFLNRYSQLWELKLLLLIVGIPSLAILCSSLLMREPLAPALKKWNETIKRYFKIAYVAAGVSLLVAMTVVPCFGFFKLAHDAATEMAAKHGQLRALVQVLNRRDRISSFYDKLKAPQKFASVQIQEDLDRYDQVVLKFLSFANYSRKESTEVCASEDSVEDRLQEQFDEWLALVASWFPSNELGGEMRTLKFASSKDNLVKWTELCQNVFRVEWHGDKNVPPVPTVDSTFAEWDGITGSGWIGLGLLCGLVGGWLFLLMKNIFLAVGQSPPPCAQVDWQCCRDIIGNFLVLGDPRSGRSSRLSQISGINYFDLRNEADNPNEKAVFPHDAVVGLDHFDFNMDNGLRNQARLQLLERLVYKDRCHVVLVSCIDPIFYLTDVDSRILADDPHLAAEYLERWIGVMSAFQKVTLADPKKKAFEELVSHNDGKVLPPLMQWMKDECSHTAYLRAFGMLLFHEHQSIGPGKPPPYFDPRRALDRLVDHSESYYSVLWSTLSPREHLVLYQLAEDGFANTKNDRAIQQLQRKGLVLCAPMLRIMNDSFRLFVLKAENQREIAEWEQQGQQSSWRSVKIVFIATAVGLIAWLFYAQKDLFQVSIGYVVTLGAAVTAIANALSGMRGRSGAPPNVDVRSPHT